MIYNIEEYLTNKQLLIERMDKAQAKITELESFGIDVCESLKKIQSAKNIVQNDKISVVLVGAFSDGKTSVAAGWLNEKLDNMKIASDESSDEILCYTPNSIPKGCQIVDTPGLFGDKVGNDEKGMRISLSDKTKRFISEANLILYVVTAKNPIKESHKECIRWILKDLNKLTSTIFVINRMDDVADLTDDDDYALQARIKTENLRGKLSECGFTPAEIREVKIACISAAPNGRGIEIWHEHRDEYLKRSHLSALEKMTNAILQNSRESLIAKTGCDILNDELSKTWDFVCEQENQIETIILPERKEALRCNEKDLANLEKKLLRSKDEMTAELRVMEKKKISAIRSATMESFKDVMEDEIGLLPGEEGYRLNNEINDIFQRYANQYSGWTVEVGESFQAQYNKQNEKTDSLLKIGAKVAADGLKGAGKIGVDAFKGSIFAGREVLGKLGVVVKFKPWQVTKMATFTTKALPVIEAAVDVISNIVENINEKKNNQKFENLKDEVKHSITVTFADIMKMLNDNKRFIAEFAPQYRVLKAQILQDDNDIREQEELLKRFKKWAKTVADSDFSFM